jgi:hypothetical protein
MLEIEDLVEFGRFSIPIIKGTRLTAPSEASDRT